MKVADLWHAWGRYLHQDGQVYPVVPNQDLKKGSLLIALLTELRLLDPATLGPGAGRLSALPDFHTRQANYQTLSEYSECTIEDYLAIS